MPSRAFSWAKTAAKPAVSSRATGTRATSSRFRARVTRDPLALFDFFDQRDRVGARAQVVAGDRVAALRRQRAGLDRARVALVVELDRRREVRRGGRGRARPGRRRRCRGTRPGGSRTRRRRRARRPGPRRRGPWRPAAGGGAAAWRRAARGAPWRPRRRRGGGPRSRSGPPPRRRGRSGSRPPGWRCGAAASSSRKASAVMLSRPPARFASSTRARTAALHRGGAGEQLARSAPRRASSSARPSRSGRRRPGRPATVCTSTSTSGSGPSARVMIERCGWSSAWASVSWPLRRISSTSEWSRVSRSSLPPRSR